MENGCVVARVLSRFSSAKWLVLMMIAWGAGCGPGGSPSPGAFDVEATQKAVTGAFCAGVTADFCDDFQDGNATSPPWTVRDQAVASDFTVVTDGDKVYKQGNSSTTNARRISTAGAGWGHVMVEAKIKVLSFKSASTNWVGLYARYNTSNNTGYAFALGGDGKVSLRKKTTGSDGTCINATYPAGGCAQTVSPAIALNTWYTLKFVINGSTLTGYLNGTRVIEGTDSSYTTGVIGVGSTGGSTFEADEVAVNRIMGTCDAGFGVPKAAGTVCRAANGVCDRAETCDGTNLTCPADTYQPSGTVCRSASGTCDSPETCTGTSTTCPAEVETCSSTCWAFCDNFESGNSSKWTVKQGNASDFSVVTDSTKVYKEAAAVASTWHVSQAGKMWLGQAVEAKLKALSFSSSSAYMALFGRYETTSAGDCAYYAALRGDGKVALGKRLNGVDSVLGTPVAAGIAAGTWYAVKLDLQGSTIDVYLNGSKILTQTDTTCEAGMVGVASLGASFESDDVRVTAPATNTCIQQDRWRNGACDSCSGQTQSDKIHCVDFLDCYAQNGCSPETCGGQDDVCGVNHPGLNSWGTAPKVIADQVYKCMGCPGSVKCDMPRKPNSTACADGNACTTYDSCQSGVCVGTSPVTCYALDQCHNAGTCDTIMGTCSNPNKADGTTCNDGNLCTQTDTCQVGTCVGANPVVCTARDQCHNPGICDPARGTCSNPAKPAGTVCRDAAGPCDLAEVCDGTDAGCPMDHFAPATTVCRASAGPCDLAELCSGSSAGCPADGFVAAGAVCRAVAGPCDVAEVCSGANSACPDDGLVAAGTVCRTATGTCDVAEACDGTSPWCPADGKAPDGIACNDDNACTRSDLCQQGVCVGNDPLTCLTLDPCHSRQCDQTTGVCVATQFPDGTPCDDHNACTYADACHAGVCAGTTGSEDCDPNTSSCLPPAVVCAQPSNPCLRSVCEPHSGSCIIVPMDGKICDDGDPGTQNDICVAGACGGHHQTDGVCAAMPAIEDSLRNDPDYVAAVQKGEVESSSHAFTVSADPVANMSSTFVTIPVAFHVLDLNGTPTVTDDEITAELARINQEFRNAFYTDLTDYAHSVAGNPRIQFALAQRTPTCQATTGIERRNTTTTDFDICYSTAIQFAAQGGLDAWTNANNPASNPVNYLNIWISPIDRDPEGDNPRDCTAATSGILTGGVAGGTRDGIVSYPRAFRLKSATNPQPYRGISHEIGHWLGLYHTFATGSTICEGANETPNTGDCATKGDLICDTPACTMQRTCPEDDPPNPKDPAYIADTCTDTPTNNVDMFNNLMGYYGTRTTYHTCRNMFTADQSLRMQGVLLGGLASGMQSLLSSAGLIPPVSGSDIWMADSQADTGDEPNSRSALLYDSDDIWNRETCDGLPEHQNPKYGSTNCLYVRIRNRGCSDVTGSSSKQLTLYWAKASTALSWPNPWTGKVNVKGTSVKMGGELGSATLTSPSWVIGSGQSTIGSVEWSPPNPQDYSSFGGDKNHFCLLARISGDGSPAKGETSDLASNVKKNKTIVWKNVEVTSDLLDKRAYVTVGPAASGPMNLIFTELTGDNNVSLFDRWGTVEVDLGTGLYAKWVAGGKKGSNVTEKSPGIVVLEGKDASLDNLSLGADDYFTLQLTFAPYPDNPQEWRRMPDVYRFDVSETSATGDLIGGQRVALKTYAAAGFNHHPPIP